MIDGHPTSARTQPSRRTVVRGAAWTVPTVMIAGAAPAFATSPCYTPASWYAASRIVFTDPDYSNANFDAQVTLESTPPGAMSIQHWVSNKEQTLNWRIPFGFPSTGGGAQAGATITIPFDPSYTSPTTPGQPSGFDRFRIFGAVQPELYTQNLPTPTITRTTSAFVITFPTEIAPGSAGVFSFTATAVGGGEAVRRGDTYTQTATANFTPITC